MALSSYSTMNIDNSLSHSKGVQVLWSSLSQVRPHPRSQEGRPTGRPEIVRDTPTSALPTFLLLSWSSTRPCPVVKSLISTTHFFPPSASHAKKNNGDVSRTNGVPLPGQPSCPRQRGRVRLSSHRSPHPSVPTVPRRVAAVGHRRSVDVPLPGI